MLNRISWNKGQNWLRGLVLVLGLGVSAAQAQISQTFCATVSPKKIQPNIAYISNLDFLVTLSVPTVLDYTACIELQRRSPFNSQLEQLLEYQLGKSAVTYTYKIAGGAPSSQLASGNGDFDPMGLSINKTHLTLAKDPSAGAPAKLPLQAYDAEKEFQLSGATLTLEGLSAMLALKVYEENQGKNNLCVKDVGVESVELGWKLVDSKGFEASAWTELTPCR